MRELLNDLFRDRLSRRGFLAGMVSAGYSLSAARSALHAVSPFLQDQERAHPFTRPASGTGGDLLADQLIEAGARYLFVCNGSGLGALCDALVSRPQIQLIQAVQEGQVVSIADGYAKASGRIGFGMYSRVGTPHSTSNMYNSMKDRTPIVMFSDHADTSSMGRDTHEDVDDWLEPVKQYTKWRWLVGEPSRIPEWVRQACKVASVLPGGPTYVRIPRDLLYRTVSATIFAGEAFHIPIQLRPDPRQVERAARLLFEASSPLLFVGPEVSQCGARAALVELAELLAIPVVQDRSFFCDFPNFHPLHVAQTHGGAPPRQPDLEQIDCFLNFGARAPVGRTWLRDGRPVIHASVDPDTIGRNTPLRVALLGHLGQVARDLSDAIRGMATPQRLEARTAQRRAELAAYTARLRETRVALARRAAGEPVPWPRVMVELNDLLEHDAVLVDETGSSARVLNFFPFDEDAKLKIGRTEGRALGWGVGASIGVKLALPDRQVVSIQGDGGFLFGQSDALWTMSRYDVPVLTVILNNRSYEETRWRILERGGASMQAGRDYVSYLGDPDVDFTKLAAAYRIGGEIVHNTNQLRSAIERGLRTLREGRPYLLDVRTQSVGLGAEITWYPKFSLAQQRERTV